MRVGALLLTPGAGSDRNHSALRAIEDAVDAAARRTRRLPVPQGGTASAGPRAEVDRIGARGSGGARRARPASAVVARARRPLDGRAHVLDGGGRRPVRPCAGADQLSAASARQAREPAGRALSRSRRAVPVRERHEGPVRFTRRARASRQGHPRRRDARVDRRRRRTTSSATTRTSPARSRKWLKSLR